MVFAIARAEGDVHRGVLDPQLVDLDYIDGKGKGLVEQHVAVNVCQELR